MPKQSGLTDATREYDLIIFGASGFTGQLCARHVATHLPSDLKWAVAGRSASKLAGIVEEVQALNADRLAPAIEECSLSPGAVNALAARTRVLLSCVGPFSLHGEVAVAACAAAGTAYVDSTGEVPWVARMIERHGASARASGALLLPQCGFDSAASDLLAWQAARCLRAELGAATGHVAASIHAYSLGVSGGTLATFFAIFDVFSARDLHAAFKPFALSPVPHPEPKSAPRSWLATLTDTYVHPVLGPQTAWLMGRVNSSIVQRTWGLFENGSVGGDEKSISGAYGPRFTYRETLRAPSRLVALAMAFGMGLGSLLLALVPPFRWIGKRLVRQPGLGPSAATDASSFIDMRAIADADYDGDGKKPSGGGSSSSRQAMSRLHWKGSMYVLTAAYLVEAVGALLKDDTPLHHAEGGFYTPACLGESFAERMRKAGMTLESKLI